MTNYVALLRKEPNSDYGVDFPDFPGCVTAGRSLEEAQSMAKEALALHVEGILADAEDRPTATDLDRILKAPENRDALAFLVDAPELSPARSAE